MKTPTNINWAPLDGIKPEKRGRGYSHFTEDEGERIRQFYYQSGLPARVIAERLGTNIHTIYNVIHRQIKYTRPLLATLTMQQIRAYHKRHVDGENIAALSREIGCHPASLRYQFRKHGWHVRTEAEEFKKRKAAVRAELMQGRTRAQIRQRLQLGKNQLDKAIVALKRDGYGEIRS